MDILKLRSRSTAVYTSPPCERAVCHKERGNVRVMERRLATALPLVASSPRDWESPEASTEFEAFPLLDYYLGRMISVARTRCQSILQHAAHGRPRGDAPALRTSRKIPDGRKAATQFSEILLPALRLNTLAIEHINEAAPRGSVSCQANGGPCRGRPTAVSWPLTAGAVLQRRRWGPVLSSGGGIA